jgi:hypothetical protein
MTGPTRWLLTLGLPGDDREQAAAVGGLRAACVELGIVVVVVEPVEPVTERPKMHGPCLECSQGRYAVQRTLRGTYGVFAFRYLRCDACKHHAKETLDASTVPKRTRKVVTYAKKSGATRRPGIKRK